MLVQYYTQRPRRIHYTIIVSRGLSTTIVKRRSGCLHEEKKNNTSAATAADRDTNTEWNNTHTYAISVRAGSVCVRKGVRGRIIFGLREDIWFFFLCILFPRPVCRTFQISWCPEPIARRNT